jgi:hypothetical protein
VHEEQTKPAQALLSGLARHARADGTYTRLLALARVDVLVVVDDWTLAPLEEAERRDVLEILEDRSGTHST